MVRACLCVPACVFEGLVCVCVCVCVCVWCVCVCVCVCVLYVVYIANYILENAVCIGSIFKLLGSHLTRRFIIVEQSINGQRIIAQNGVQYAKCHVTRG